MIAMQTNSVMRTTPATTTGEIAGGTGAAAMARASALSSRGCAGGLGAGLLDGAAALRASARIMSLKLRSFIDVTRLTPPPGETRIGRAKRTVEVPAWITVNSSRNL